MAAERTFIMVKPDGVQRGIVGSIVSRFEAKGFQLLSLRQMSPSREHLEKHYADLSGKGFFASLINYMASSPVVAMVWAGDGVVAEGRKMLGATKPSESAMGTIRGDYCIDIGRNVCHGSDSVESAEHEITLWSHYELAAAIAARKADAPPEVRTVLDGNLDAIDDDDENKRVSRVVAEWLVSAHAKAHEDRATKRLARLVLGV